MKLIQNKATEVINVDDQGNKLGQCSYSHLISIAIRQRPANGYDWNDVENRIAIQKAIADHPATIQLEDSYFTYLKKVIEISKWTFFHEDLQTFKEDIMAIK